MRNEELDLLREQLAEACMDPAASPLEKASLAGLLERLAPDEPVLSGLRIELAGPASIDLYKDALDALDALAEIDEDDDATESWDALCVLDELCAGATFLGCATQITGPLDDACSIIRAFPEPYIGHTIVAIELLRDRTPRAGDPARRLWQTVAEADEPRNS